MTLETLSKNRIGIRLETEELNYDKIKKGKRPDENLTNDGDIEGVKIGGEGSEPENPQAEIGQHGGRGRHGSRPENKDRPKRLELKLSVQLAGAPFVEQK